MDVIPQSDADLPAVPSADEIDAITSRRFSSSFRGWNADEVRVHLVEIAETVRSLVQRQGELQRRLAEAEAAVRRADLTRLEPEEVSRVLGEETARVLFAARESASQIEAKARAQAELLVSQAADDAAGVRAEAREEAARLVAEAEESASAVRTAGTAHVEDLRAQAESELADERVAMQEQIAAERQAAQDEATAIRSAVDEEAERIRRAATEDAEQTRAEAADYADQVRAESDAQAEQARLGAEQQAREVTERAVAEVAAARDQRDRVLSDLAQRRRAARRHLEQLHAGRDRLLTAYEVIRATTDQATAELEVVLGDAKQTADEAARRIGAEPLPTPEEMLAELNDARLEDPSLGTRVLVADHDEERDAGSAAGDVDDAAAHRVDAEDGAEDASADGGASAGEESEPDEPVVDDEPVADGEADGVDPVVPDLAAVAAAMSDPDPDPVDVAGDGPAAARPAHRRHGRRGKRRHDPLEGDALPEVPMVPVAAGAEFESVRVVSSADVAETASTAVGAPAEAKPAEADGPDADEPASSNVAARDVPSTAAAADAPTGTGNPDAVAASNPSSVPSPDGAAPPVDAAAGIFARLRAETSGDETSAATTTETVPAEADRDDPARAAVERTATDAAPKKRTRTKKKPSPAKRPDGPAPATGADGARLASLFERRDAAVDDAARLLSKHLKRVLSDQQSELLDDLRRTRGQASSGELIAEVDAFTESWRPVAEKDLVGAVEAGISLVADLRPGTPTDVAVDVTGPVTELIDAIAMPLRGRLVRAIDDGVGEVDAEDAEADDERELADRIRACYREWRGARLSAAVSDVCAHAFGLGVRAAVGDRAPVQWYCGPGDAPCSDCNDNRLAGGVAAGQVFPTGQAVAPAHPGCRCLVLPELA